ncbi:MAG: hypothetical protein Athens071426_118 [Parcubacteria group bacterium Athens0714_26]|nr:MAG: hypothetical protein Athens101426_662 [Parcubacteria group bacterium Athens1014_26]TSD03670.1 MAG: hypothetical protein Athens071426_118 [Parcubacteria group bacterium Athens0714_26]
MTIIQPNKNKYSISASLIFVILALILMAIFSIYLYNQNVDMRHSISIGMEQLQSLQEVNAEYKDKIYQILDFKNAETMAKELNLVQEKNPAYLESNSKVLAEKGSL